MELGHRNAVAAQGLKIVAADCTQLSFQLLLKLRHPRLVLRCIGQVVKLLGVTVHVEQFHPARCVLAILNEGPLVFAQQKALRMGATLNAASRTRWLGVIEHCRNVLALQPRRHLQTTQGSNRRKQIQQFDQRLANCRSFARNADDQRHLSGLIPQTDLGPKVVLAQVVAVVAGKDHDRVVFQARGFQCVEHLANLPIHKRHRSIVAADGFLLSADVHLHVATCLVVNAGLRNVVPIASQFFWKGHAIVRLERWVVRTRGHERNMRPHESDTKKERLLGTGKPILLLHGFDSSVFEFRRLVPQLGNNAQVWAMDLLGFGFTDRTTDAPITPVAIKQHIYSFWQQQIGEPMILVGASMGGAAAIDVTLDFPDVVEKLVLLDSAGFAAGPAMGKLMVPPLDSWATAFLRNPGVRRRISQQAYCDRTFVTADAELCAALHLQMPNWKKP